MNWYISVDIPGLATMASGGLCGHGVMKRMPLPLVPCQALIESGNIARKRVQTIKTLTLPDAGRRDGL
jgi:hypothetical protein